MMSHSFKEFETQSKKPDTLAQLESAELQMSKIPVLGEHLEPLCEFYECAYEYLQQYQKFMAGLVTSKRVDLKPGKVVIISQGRHYNRLGIYLSSYITNSKSNYTVLVLDNPNAAEESAAEKFNKMVSKQNASQCYLFIYRLAMGRVARLHACTNIRACFH